MKIDSFKINQFGTLKEKEIKLDSHINLIYGKNESGKSTLLKFLVGMFYGLSKNKNGKWTSDFEKYTPWEEGDFSGKIQYHLENGEHFEVFREFKKKNPKIYDDNSVDITKHFPTDKTKGSLFFQEQSGLEEELFCSTIVTEQAGVKLEEKNRQSVIQKVANLMGTGQDYTSFEKVISKLNKRQLEEVGTEKSQERPMNKIKKRMEELQKEIERLEQYHSMQYEIQERKESLKSQIQEKENKFNALKEIKKAQEEIQLEEEKINLKQQDLEEYQKKIEQIEVRKQKILDEKVAVPKLSYTATIVGGIVGIFLLLIGILLSQIVLEGVAILIFVASLGYGLWRRQVQKKQMEQVDTEKEKDIEILNQQINMIQENEVEKKEAVLQLQKKIEEKWGQEAARIKNKYIHKLSNIEELLQKKNIAYEVEYLQNHINGKKLELQGLELEEKQMVPELETLSSRKEEWEHVQEQYQYLQEYAQCIQLAKQGMEEAHLCMKQSVTPKFTQKLSENMQYISKGKYSNVKLNAQNEIMVETENGNYVSAEALSIGTIDQMYLALRFAIAEELGKESMPIILDEAFAYFDEERLANVLEFLHNQFKNRQILIFTCTKREENILEKKAIPHHNIRI